ncbi:DUF808 domain-containing protein [Oceanisphaera arctica]|uniref:DUF808 domain-containing protein n=1 Tax=Oceanisphaera arctica TaxID=641510 RepID=A0A2P5TMG8_9GAMM|nr:DUF808 domain-containing protein [Oceanisphaera arctica]PPL16643.1 hypothetical protein UN63_07885 [Oceanisphaera arctica]GHA21150.1 membrane protein [Oceanisphaera arctica]
MAGASLLSLLDDIATLLDDVSLMTKVAAKKTAGVLGDDLALNAQQVSGVRAEREIPVVWAVAKGSMRNKLILVPAALLISALAPWAIIPLLMLGGAFLCFEGVEKLVHSFQHKASNEHRHLAGIQQAEKPESVDLVTLERDKIKGAIRTDFILSAEIIVITLGTVAGAGFGQQVAVLAGIAVLMTVGVYGLVAGIVKLDDLGLYLSKKTGLAQILGQALLSACPYLMKGLSVVGTAAMFLVGGGILVHGIPGAETLIHDWSQGLPLLGGGLNWLAPMLLNGIVGILAGSLVLLLVNGVCRLKGT